LAAQFATKDAAEKPCTQAQEVIRTIECELSVFRFLVPDQRTTPRWFVVALGETPPDAVQQRIMTILSQGELTRLPEQVVAALLERRATQIKRGPWVEAHYNPTLKKKNKRQP
jgi:hypothetical protein